MNFMYGVIIEIFVYLLIESNIRFLTFKYNLDQLEATRRLGVSSVDLLKSMEITTIQR